VLQNRTVALNGITIKKIERHKFFDWYRKGLALAITQEFAQIRAVQGAIL
jgi:hypothetical protein